MELPRHLEKLVEQPVDAVADDRAVLERLDVDVRGAVAGGPCEHVVDELDDGGVVRLRPQLLEVDRVLRPGAGKDGQAELLAHGFVVAVRGQPAVVTLDRGLDRGCGCDPELDVEAGRSEEHTSELQSLAYLVCRLLLEKKKNNKTSMCTCRQ